MTTLHARKTRRLALVGIAWAAATLFGLAVAAVTSVGPVVASLSEKHGVHLGDLVAFGGAYLMALVVTVAVYSR